MRSSRKELDEAFPTIVRYGGFLLVFIITALLVLGYPVASGYVPAAGMVFYKTLRGSREDDWNGRQ